MSRNGKSYRQWFKEVECAITKRGFSVEYANAQTLCVHSLYINKTNFEPPEFVAKYALRNVKGYKKTKRFPQCLTARGAERGQE